MVRTRLFLHLSSNNTEKDSSEVLEICPDTLIPTMEKPLHGDLDFANMLPVAPLSSKVEETTFVRLHCRQMSQMDCKFSGLK